MSRWAGVAVLALGCAEPSAGSVRPPRFAPEVRAIFAARCARCHEGADAASGWRFDTFASALGCSRDADGPDAAAPAPVLRALARDDHRELLSATERATITAWVRGGAAPPSAGVHDEGVGDPRAATFHAQTLRAARWSLMLSPDAPGACGRCHAGAPTRPARVTQATPGATACSTCHAGPQGALGCDTCHRVGDAPGATGCVAPQRDRARDAHAAHLAPRLRAQGFACGVCHPARDATLAQGEHGDGVVQVRFDPTIAGEDARYDRLGGTCTVQCHNRGGTMPAPRWRGGAPATCESCHGAPPQGHPAGACDGCHAEADAAGATLRPGPLHLNGVVDLGAGEGGCAACHGGRGDPWPESGAHLLHRDAPRARPVACESCHTVPDRVRAEGHLDGRVQVSFGEAARARGARPSWSGGACAEVACHGAGLRGASPPLRWSPVAPASGCGSCHGVPPAAPHTDDPGCASVLCHGGTVAPSPAGPTISAAGRATHIDGVVQFGRRP